MSRVVRPLGLVLSVILLASEPFSPSVSAVSPHDYFNALVKRPYHFKSFSLRSQAQLTTYKNANSVPMFVNYVWPSDPDAHQQDAAKVVIPAFSYMARAALAVATSSGDTVLYLSAWSSEFYAGRAAIIDSEAVYVQTVNATAKTITVTRGFAGTTPAPHAAGVPIRLNVNSLENQVRLPIGAVDGAVYLITWDSYWTDSYLSSGLSNHKTFQLSAWTTDSLWLEPQTRYAGDYGTGFNKATDVGSLTIRSYNSLGGSTTYSTNTKPSTGPSVTKLDPLSPMQGEFIVKPNRWVRHWVRLDMRASDYDYLDYWVADEMRNAVQIYKALPVTANQVTKFWIEFNTSTDRFVRGNLRDLVAYVRNVVVLKNVPAADLPALFEPPIGSTPGPPPPANLRIVK